jgi:ABC-type uncharacterized transport system YnjBCD ATPase subunit
MTSVTVTPAAVAGRGISVRAHRDGRLLLDGVSFTAPAGEILTLLGPIMFSFINSKLNSFFTVFLLSFDSSI